MTDYDQFNDLMKSLVVIINVYYEVRSISNIIH